MAGVARAMGATLTEAQKFLVKNQKLFYSSLNLHFGPHTFTNYKAAHSPLPNRLICNTSGVLRQYHQALSQNCGIVT